MKTILIGTSLIMGLAPLAHAGPEEGQFAVVKTVNSCKVTVPTGYSSSQVYFSKDCTTAFILPGENIPAHIDEPIYLTGSNDSICNAFQEQNKVQASYQERIDALNKKIESVATERPSNEEDRKNIAFQLRELKKQVAYLEAKITNVIGAYDNMAALRLHYSLASNQMDALAAFQTASLVQGPVGPVGNDVYPVRFMPAQLEGGVLAVSNPDALTYPGRSVIKVNFPGYPVKMKSKLIRDPNATYVTMNGGLSGVVDISASAYCSNKAKGKNDAQIIGRVVALNYMYNVRAQAGKKLYVNATIATKDFLKNLSASIVSGKFERREFTEKYIAGGLSNSINISLDDKGINTYGLTDLLLGVHDNEESSPLAILVSKVLSSYVDRAESKLEQLGVFVKDPDAKPRDLPAGTEDRKVGERRVCSSNNGFFGIGASSSCTNEPIIVKIDRDGLSTLAEQTQDNSYIEETVSFESNETIAIPKSSFFSF